MGGAQLQIAPLPSEASRVIAMTQLPGSMKHSNSKAHHGVSGLKKQTKPRTVALVELLKAAREVDAVAHHAVLHARGRAEVSDKHRRRVQPASHVDLRGPPARRPRAGSVGR